MNPIQKMIADNIQKYGIALQYVFPTENDPSPSFLYTIGMTDLGAPELIVFGLDPNMMMPIFNQIFFEIRQGIRPKKNSIIDDLMSVPLHVHPVAEDAISEYGIQCLAYYEQKGVTPTFSQVLWPDKAGKYPFERDFQENMKEYQPYIGTAPEKKMKLIIDNDGPRLH